MFRFSTPVPPRLSIELRAGTVDVETADVTETTVELVAARTTQGHPRGDRRRHRRAARRRHHRPRPRALRSFSAASPERRRSRSRAPDASALRVKTGSADVVGRRHGSRTTSIDTGSGDIDARRRRRLAARQARQRRRPRRARRPATSPCKTGSGDVDARRRRGRGLVHQRVRRPRRVGSGGRGAASPRPAAATSPSAPRPPTCASRRPRATSASTPSTRARCAPRRRRATSTPASAPGPRRGSTCTRSAAGSRSALDAGGEPAAGERRVACSCRPSAATSSWPGSEPAPSRRRACVDPS